MSEHQEDCNLDDSRATRIEEDIKTININVAKLYRTVAEVTTVNDVWRKTMCVQHSVELTDVKKDLEELKPKVNNRWPTLIASFIGSIFATFTVAGVIIKIMKGVSP